MPVLRHLAHYLVVAAMEGFAENRLFARCEVPLPPGKAECCFRRLLYTALASGFCKVACTTVAFTRVFTIGLYTKELCLQREVTLLSKLRE